MPDSDEKAVVKQRSPGGKFNALRHGLTANSVLLPFESPISYGRLVGRLNRELKPQDGYERLLVSQMVLPIWRLRRLAAAEAGLFTHYTEKGWHSQRQPLEERPAVQLGEALIEDHKPGAFTLLLRYRNSEARQLLRLQRELRAYRAERRGKEGTDDGSEIAVSPVRDLAPSPLQGTHEE